MALGGQIVGDVVAGERTDLFLAARFSENEEFHIRVCKLGEMERELAAGEPV